jgi:transmembrane sensor
MSVGGITNNMEEQHQQEVLLAALLEKFLAGKCTEAEKAVVMEWYARYEDQPEEQPAPEVMHSIYEGILHRLPEVTLAEEQPRIRRRMPVWIAAAAVVFLLVLAGGIWQWVVYRQTHQLADTEGRFRNDVAPGVSKARLLMGNGDIVDLSATANGNIGLQGSAQVNKQDSMLVYQHTGNKGTKEVVYNTLEIPRGGQYCVVLPDGTRVWLNAASSLRFPTAFMGKTREVTLHGEGYFEVAKDAGHPFVVQLEKGAVEVLGTHFNITDYADEQTVATTLLEGAVRVQQGGAATILQPGEQSKWSRENRPPQVSKVDTEATIAWKNGLFTFSNTDINEVMRQLARWYDVEVVYEAPVNIRLNGMISRYSSLSQVLKILELTGEAHFTIAGRKITVKHQ